MEHHLKITYILLLLEVRHMEKMKKIYVAVMRVQHPANSTKDENVQTEIQPVSCNFS